MVVEVAVELLCRTVGPEAFVQYADPEIPYNLGAVLWRRSDYPRAATKFRRALVLDPRHEEARRWFPRTQRAVRDIEQLLLQGDDKKEEGNK